jgi:hypothetical protein
MLAATVALERLSQPRTFCSGQNRARHRIDPVILGPRRMVDCIRFAARFRCALKPTQRIARLLATGWSASSIALMFGIELSEIDRLTGRCDQPRSISAREVW